MFMHPLPKYWFVLWVRLFSVKVYLRNPLFTRSLSQWVNSVCDSISVVTACPVLIYSLFYLTEYLPRNMYKT